MGVFSRFMENYALFSHTTHYLLWVISVLVEIIVLIFELEYYRMLDAVEKDFHVLIQVGKGQ